VFEINIQVQGVEEIRRVLLESPEVAELAIEDAATTLRNLVIGRTPVLSGETKDSWSEVERTSTGFTFGTAKEHAPILEEGGYKSVGPRTVAVGGGIFSKQAPGGIMAPILANEDIMNQIVRRISEELVRSISRAS
jgi:hypothetical protein